MTIPPAESSGDLFRPGGRSATPPAARPPAEEEQAEAHPDLRRSTPIFDDVATAWFRRDEIVPQGWTQTARIEGGSQAPVEERGRRPDQTGDEVSDAAPVADEPQRAEAVTDPEPAEVDTEPEAAEAVTGPEPVEVDTEPEPVGSDTEPEAIEVVAEPEVAEVVVEPEPELEPEPEPEPVEAVLEPDPEPSPAAETSVRPRETVPAAESAAELHEAGWGGADAGWQAAQALYSPGNAGFTAAGLPRRQPRALLVPGAVAEPAESGRTRAPSRSAESVRGRLASYQQGIREGRQVRNRRQHDEDEPGFPQETRRET